MTRPADKSDSRSTSRWIVARDDTANAPLPLTMTRDVVAFEPAPISPRTRAKRSSISSIACCCPSISEPALFVCAIRIARSPLADAQAPSKSRGRDSDPPASRSTKRIVSPVGSRGRIALSIIPAGDDRASMLSLIAARRPSTVKRSFVTASDNR